MRRNFADEPVYIQMGEQMKDNREINDLREHLWRQELTPLERRKLRETSDRETQKDLALENALTSALRRLPDASAPSNFTQRVLNGIHLQQEATLRQAQWRILFRRWLPRLAAGCAMAAALLVWNHKAQTDRAAEMARSLAILTAPALTPEILRDFDAIQVMSRTPVADEDLLALMQ